MVTFGLSVTSVPETQFCAAPVLPTRTCTVNHAYFIFVTEVFCPGQKFQIKRKKCTFWRIATEFVNREMAILSTFVFKPIETPITDPNGFGSPRCLVQLLTNTWQKYIYQFKEIHFPILTIEFSNLNKYIF